MDHEMETMEAERVSLATELPDGLKNKLDQAGFRLYPKTRQAAVPTFPDATLRAITESMPPEYGEFITNFVDGNGKYLRGAALGIDTPSHAKRRGLIDQGDPQIREFDDANQLRGKNMGVVAGTIENAATILALTGHTDSAAQLNQLVEPLLAVMQGKDGRPYDALTDQERISIVRAVEDGAIQALRIFADTFPLVPGVTETITIT